jgi:hypothetical protein
VGIPAPHLAAAIVGRSARRQFVVNQAVGPFAGPPNPTDKAIDPGNGIIFGRATEAGTTRPVPNAIVTLTLPGASPLRVMADAEGQFAFRDLPPGRFTITASKAGYVDGSYGRLRPNGPTQSVELVADQHVSDADIPLWRYAAITGRVTDESGDPIVNATVRVLRRAMVAGRRQLVTGATDTTDDRGTYRISSLEPGDYVVVVPMTREQARIRSSSPGLPRDVMAALPAGGGGGGEW